MEEDLEDSSVGLRSAGWPPHWPVDPAPWALWAARGEGFSEGRKGLIIQGCLLACPVPGLCILFEQVLITQAGNPENQSCFFFPPRIGHSNGQPDTDSSEVASVGFLEASAALSYLSHFQKWPSHRASVSRAAVCQSLY